MDEEQKVTSDEEEFIGFLDEIDEDHDVLPMASQWQLMWRSFRKHKTAKWSGLVLIMLYLLAVFADFFSPYDPNVRSVQHRFAPPQRIRFVDENGDFSIRPFTYRLVQSVDLRTMAITYEEDSSKKYYLKFVVRGPSYRILRVFSSRWRLFGIEEGGTLFFFGTNRYGSDVFSRILFGARISLTVGLMGVALSFILGLSLGSVSGFYGGVVDSIIQRVTEVIRSFPTIPLWMALAAALPRDWSALQVYFGVTVILSLVGWTDLSRQARGKVLSVKNEDFVLAARLAGVGEATIVLRHLIPSFASHIIASLTLAIPGMILGETALSFLGIGLRPPVISWGVLLQEAQNIHSVAMAPWLIFPGLFVIVTVLAFNFLGDGLRDAADPYSN